MVTGLGMPVLLGLIAVSVVASLVVLWLISLANRMQANAAPIQSATDAKSNFLFHGDALVDHDVEPLSGRFQNMEALADWPDVRRWLSSRFDSLPENLASLPDQTVRSLRSRTDGPDDLSSELCLERTGNFTKLTLQDVTPPSPAAWHAAEHAVRNADQAQNVLDHAPYPIWKTNADGHVIWQNAPCDAIADMIGSLPLPVSEPQFRPPPYRFSTCDPDGGRIRWYEVSSRRLGDDMLHIATGIDKVVRAESAQRDFVQTLTKTFANLTTGLAVFDKDCRLALFNPALVDLTGVSVTFLSARPDVIRFFDELRERQVLPEPKNYANLRAQIRDVIAKAHKDCYLEIWNLPGGVTYRVTGRPHPDGAVAFLFEDISAEILKTRQFRSQIDLGRSVIDGLPDAIVVIGPNDLIMLCNTACSELLKIDPDSSFADMSVHDLIKACRDQFDNNAQWMVFETALRKGTSTPHDAPAALLNSEDGTALSYRIRVLPGGARMVTFSALADALVSPEVSAAE